MRRRGGASYSRAGRQMLNGVFDLARPMLLAFEAERAHEMTLRALERGLHPANVGGRGGELAVQVMGLDFPNPVGIAAGFDKDARVFSALHKIGLVSAKLEQSHRFPNKETRSRGFSD